MLEKREKKQFQDLWRYDSQVQRDIDNARQSSLTKKNVDNDPDILELDRPPDEEDSDEELEV